MKNYRILWNEYDRDVKILANKIKQSNLRFDAIMTIPRGGLVIACHLSYLLNIQNIVLEDDCFDFTPNILLVDDVSDSGKTLQETIDLLEFKPTIATLYRKDNTIFEPDFSVKTINDWIVYPWEE